MRYILYSTPYTGLLNRLCARMFHLTISRFDTIKLRELVELNRIANRVFGERQLAAHKTHGNRLYFTALDGRGDAVFYIKAVRRGVVWWKADHASCDDEDGRWAALLDACHAHRQ